MIIQVYAVHDKAVNAYLQPFYARSGGEAIRSFTELANDTNTNVAKHPTDFVLYALGAYDDSSGLFSCGEPVRILGANEVLRDIAMPGDAGIERAQALRNGRSV